MVRRKTTWLDTVLSFQVSNGSQVVRAIDGTPSVGDAQGRTLTRLIGKLAFHSTTVAGAWGVQNMFMGAGAASREAFTAGALPDPGSPTEEPTLGWIYRGHVAVAQNGSGAPVVFVVEFDLRAQRKLDSGRHWMSFENTDIDGTSFTMAVNGFVRALYLLP